MARDGAGRHLDAARLRVVEDRVARGVLDGDDGVGRRPRRGELSALQRRRRGRRLGPGDGRGGARLRRRAVGPLARALGLELADELGGAVGGRAVAVLVEVVGRVVRAELEPRPVVGQDGVELGEAVARRGRPAPEVARAALVVRQDLDRRRPAARLDGAAAHINTARRARHEPELAEEARVLRRAVGVRAPLVGRVRGVPQILEPVRAAQEEVLELVADAPDGRPGLEPLAAQGLRLRRQAEVAVALDGVPLEAPPREDGHVAARHAQRRPRRGAVRVAGVAVVLGRHDIQVEGQADVRDALAGLVRRRLGRRRRADGREDQDAGREGPDAVARPRGERRDQQQRAERREDGLGRVGAARVARDARVLGGPLRPVRRAAGPEHGPRELGRARAAEAALVVLRPRPPVVVAARRLGAPARRQVDLVLGVEFHARREAHEAHELHRHAETPMMNWRRHEGRDDRVPIATLLHALDLLLELLLEQLDQLLVRRRGRVLDDVLEDAPRRRGDARRE